MALADLRKAASKVMTKLTLAQIVNHCAINDVKVSDSATSDWFTGRAIPVSAKNFGLVAGFLNGYAERGDPNYRRMDPAYWERLRRAAREERRGTQGQRPTRREQKTESDRHAELLTSPHAAQVHGYIAPLDKLRAREPEIERSTAAMSSSGS